MYLKQISLSLSKELLREHPQRSEHPERSEQIKPITQPSKIGQRCFEIASTEIENIFKNLNISSLVRSFFRSQPYTLHTCNDQSQRNVQKNLRTLGKVIYVFPISLRSIRSQVFKRKASYEIKMLPKQGEGVFFFFGQILKQSNLNSLRGVIYKIRSCIPKC